MWWRTQSKGQRAVLLVLIGVAVILFVPRVSSVLSSDAGFALIPVYLLAYLFAIVAFPLAILALFKFVYSVFARPYLRLFRMRRYRNNKDLMEAVRRSR